MTQVVTATLWARLVAASYSRKRRRSSRVMESLSNSKCTHPLSAIT